MSVNFEELDFRPTPMGVLSLRRRRLPGTDTDIYEIKLGDEFLMSSLFTVAEIELARLGLAALARADLDVVVGGLGLGYTAQAVLENPRGAIADRGRRAGRGHRMARAGAASARQATDRRSALPPRQRRLLRDVGIRPMASIPIAPGRRFDAVLVDIDHSPRNLLHPRHAALYQRRRGLRDLPNISIPAACSRCGRTIRRMRRSARRWPASSQRRMRMS